MRFALVIVGFLLAAGCLCEFGFFLIGDGCYGLSVTVKSTSSASIQAVSCEAFGYKDEAQEALELLSPPASRRRSASAEPFNGQPLSVSVPFSYRESAMGRTWGETQFRHLLVIVQYQDGKRQGKLVEIPRRRDCQSLTVEVP